MFASTQLMTVLGGFTGSLLFVFLLTGIGNLEKSMFGSSFQTQLSEVVFCLLVAMMASATIHRVRSNQGQIHYTGVLSPPSWKSENCDSQGRLSLQCLDGFPTLKQTKKHFLGKGENKPLSYKLFKTEINCNCLRFIYRVLYLTVSRCDTTCFLCPESYFLI